MASNELRGCETRRECRGVASRPRKRAWEGLWRADWGLWGAGGRRDGTLLYKEMETQISGILCQERWKRIVLDLKGKRGGLHTILLMGCIVAPPCLEPHFDPKLTEVTNRDHASLNQGPTLASLLLRPARRPEVNSNSKKNKQRCCSMFFSLYPDCPLPIQDCPMPMCRSIA